MKLFKKIIGIFIVLIGVGDIAFDKSWFWGITIIAIGLSLLIKKWGDVMFKQWGKRPIAKDAQ